MFTLRNRKHVVIVRLSDEEYHIYLRILHKAVRLGSCPNNKSDVFRDVLKVMDKMLSEEAALNFYENSLTV